MDNLKITLTYINIRQSITIMLAKLLAVDIILASILVGIYWLITYLEEFTAISEFRTFLFLITLATAGGIKVFLTILVVLQWLNEYYEITPDFIYHKKGILFRKTKAYRIDMIRRIKVLDTFIGEIFNFATVMIQDTRLNKMLDLYLIHNPERYARILKELKPDIEFEQEHTRMPFLPKKGISVNIE